MFCISSFGVHSDDSIRIDVTLLEATYLSHYTYEVNIRPFSDKYKFNLYCNNASYPAKEVKKVSGTTLHIAFDWIHEINYMDTQLIVTSDKRTINIKLNY